MKTAHVYGAGVVKKYVLENGIFIIASRSWFTFKLKGVDTDKS